MGDCSSIEWTEATWNPVTGCTKVSAGCANCYAERLANRLQAMGQARYANGFSVTIHEETLKLPLSWKRSRMVFVNSMSDLFHKDIADDFIIRVFEVMVDAPWHRFQVLTKRSTRLREMNSVLPWAANIWMGVTVEDESCLWRVDDLRQTSAAVKFLSIEPMLGPLPGLDLTGIDWVIVGGESGPKARPMQAGWVTGVRDHCQQAKVPFFFKQWGGANRKKTGRLLDGRTYDEIPTPAVSNSPDDFAAPVRPGSTLPKESK